MILKTAREIGLLIRDQRKSRKWTQQKLADLLGVGRLWVIHMEQGKSTVRLDLVLSALRELDVQLSVQLPSSTPSRVKYQNIPVVDLDSIIREHTKS